jgi:hypothetical protein
MASDEMVSSHKLWESISQRAAPQVLTPFPTLSLLPTVTAAGSANPTGMPDPASALLPRCSGTSVTIYDTISGTNLMNSPFTGFCMPTRWRYATATTPVTWQDLRAAFKIMTPAGRAAGASWRECYTDHGDILAGGAGYSSFAVTEATFFAYIQTFGAFSAARPGVTLIPCVHRRLLSPVCAGDVFSVGISANTFNALPDVPLNPIGTASILVRVPPLLATYYP